MVDLLYRLSPGMVALIPACISCLIYKKNKNQNDKLFTLVTGIETVIALIFIYIVLWTSNYIITLFTEVLNKNAINPDQIPVAKWYLVIMFTILFVIHLIVVIYIYHSVNNRYLGINNNFNEGSPQTNKDSIIEMMREATNNARWIEIIMIGEALNEVLWYTGRKKLRVQIGNYLKNAAEQSGDLECLSRTLIEDIGITNYILGNEKLGLNNIKEGINVAKRIGNDFLMCRGYRHLACCDIKEGKLGTARQHYNTANTYYHKISDPYSKLEAQVSVEYAKMKIAIYEENYTEALSIIDNCIRLHEEIAQSYPEKSKHNTDRIAKMHRQKANVYKKMDNIWESKNLYLSSLNESRGKDNHENIVLCCVELAKIYNELGDTDNAKVYISMARGSLKFVDIESAHSALDTIATKVGD